MDKVVQKADLASKVGNGGGMPSWLLRVGPLGRILRENPGLKAEAEPRLRAALAEHEEDGAVALRVATWVVTARPRA